MVRTKIVATLGPATDGEGVLEGMLDAGVDVVRLNGAHASIAELERRLADVRQAAAATGRTVGVLLDLPGPKVRVQSVAEGLVVEAGDTVRLVADMCPDEPMCVSVTYPGLADDVAPGNRILIDDGRVELLVRATSRGRVTTEVITGGPVLPHKGVNVPGVTLTVPPVTETDRALVAWACAHDVDWLGQSFVREPTDIDALRALMRASPLPVIAKIEKHEAVDRLETITEAADAVMVARGDLGVETSPERVPVVQRRVVRAARAAGRPVVIATEMLDSMRERPRPTRAEASDVANAVFGRADALMLSGETAVGVDPVAAVRTMARIVAAAEAEAGVPPPPQAHGACDDVQAAVSSAAAELAADLDLAAIITLTQSGATALAVSRRRPATPVIAVAPSERVARRLALVWGVRAVVMGFVPETGALLDAAMNAVREAGHVRAGERVAITAGLGTDTPGGTDLLHVRIA